MQGRILIGLLMATVPVAGLCADAPRRPICTKNEAQQSRHPQQQQRVKQDCPQSKKVPSVVDPTPVFLL